MTTDQNTDYNQDDFDRIATVSQAFYGNYVSSPTNPCHSIPPRHPQTHQFPDGHTYCVVCWADVCHPDQDPDQ